MKKLVVIAGWVFVLSVSGIAEAGTLFTNPVIFVQPTAMDFGPVASNATATNTFLVENMGSGKLVGTATVAAPFKILSGGDYTLRTKEAQVITVIYSPSGAASDAQTVTFTGGGGATVEATGTLKVPRSKKLKQK
jgi:hypothetical protein